jgi:very-short-patch-repair endonuclease
LATKAPPVLDPFAGGGSIPLEAQRLGLRAYASDLNPVAVLINKALIEIPPKFAGMPPVHPPHPPAPSPTRGEGEEGRFEVPEDVRRKMVEVARQFRKAPTHSEAVLWQALRDRQLDGIKFRRQQPIGPFVVDFFAPALRLVVEVDGPIHETQQEADRQREELLESVGLRVFRLAAEEVENRLPQALDKLRQFINNLPSPFMGEGAGVRATSALAASSSVIKARQSEIWSREWKGAEGLAEDVRYYGR